MSQVCVLKFSSRLPDSPIRLARMRAPHLHVKMWRFSSEGPKYHYVGWLLAHREEGF